MFFNQKQMMSAYVSNILNRKKQEKLWSAFFILSSFDGHRKMTIGVDSSRQENNFLNISLKSAVLKERLRIFKYYYMILRYILV